VLVPAFESSIDKSLIKEILATYQQRAPGFRRLQSAVVIERFPRSELGKLRRQELLKMCVSTDDRENRKENP
jgi:acyl-coenzyme A synthetase/AMP-(fatty) acid ligase